MPNQIYEQIFHPQTEAFTATKRKTSEMWKSSTPLPFFI
jgi:hypothetical protein